MPFDFRSATLRMSGRQHLLLIFMLDNTIAEGDGWMRLSYSDIQNVCACSRQYAVILSNKLIEYGLIQKKSVGRNRPNLWRVNPYAFYLHRGMDHE